MKKPKIVAIDDEAEFINMLESYFVPRGYDIAFSLRGANGLELIRERRPDIVLMDLKMPGLDGDAPALRDVRHVAGRAGFCLGLERREAEHVLQQGTRVLVHENRHKL